MNYQIGFICYSVLQSDAIYASYDCSNASNDAFSQYVSILECSSRNSQFLFLWGSFNGNLFRIRLRGFPSVMT